MPLSFNPNVPQANQTVASTQNPILVNFQSLDTSFNGPTGGGSGGGNFTTYTLQNTTANFAAKPTSPVGTLYTTASASGNPELAWINNVNATGGGPYNGIQITGGGITTAAWVFFGVNVITGAITVNTSYNVTSVTNSGLKTNKVITFTRNFTSANYVAIVNPYQQGNGTAVAPVNVVSQLAGSFTFSLGINPLQGEVAYYHCVFFGILS